MKKIISIVSPCYNEKENIRHLYEKILESIKGLERYDFEFQFIDNSSTDGTIDILKQMAAEDIRVKVIINTRNFGHIRSPYWGIIQSRGDATVYLAADLQDPPEFIPKFIKEWELGWKVVLAIKPVSQTNWLLHSFRRFYYRFLDKISEVELIKDTTGFGIYDRIVLDYVRKIGDPYPYLRGLICELGYPIKTIEFKQPRRIRGVSKNNFYTLYDIAMLGVISHSLVPLRVASIVGFCIGLISFALGILYFLLKIIYWDDFLLGVAPMMISMFFLFGILFIFIGLIGEYIGSIHRYMKSRPIVVELERINFD